MTIKECYDAMGADYNDVSSRLSSDKLILKFNQKFMADSSYDEFLKYISEDNYKDAFIKVHNIKGMSANLGYKKLYEISSQLCEMMRYGKPEKDITDLITKLTKQYDITIKYISCMEV